MFTIVPDYCPIDYTYAVTLLSDGDTAIKTMPAGGDRTFVFEYTKDDAPVSPTP